MLEPLLGSLNRERILLFLYVRNEGYARQIARYYDIDLAPVQKQLHRLELGGVLYSRAAGRTRLFGLNPRYPFINELQALLDKVLEFYAPEDRRRLEMVRRRPRRGGKPL